MTTGIDVAWVASGRTLAENEVVIARGMAGFIETGNALAEVRETDQYREAGYASFSAYLVGRWPELSRAQAYRAIDTARVVGLLSPIGDTPANEAQARELAALRNDTAGMREVWQQVRAEHGEEATAADIREAVLEYLDPEEADGDHHQHEQDDDEHHDQQVVGHDNHGGSSVIGPAPVTETPAGQDMFDEFERRQPLEDFVQALEDAPQCGLLSHKPRQLLPLLGNSPAGASIEQGLRAVRAWLADWEEALGVGQLPKVDPKGTKSQIAARAAAAGVSPLTYQQALWLRRRSEAMFQRVCAGEISIRHANGELNRRAGSS